MYVWTSHLLPWFLAWKLVLWDYAVRTSVTPLTVFESFVLCQPSLTEVSRSQRYSDSWKFHINHLMEQKLIPLQEKVKQNNRYSLVLAVHAYGGVCPCCATWHVTERACLMHWILRDFLVHFFPGCPILPRWHLEHSSCSEAPKWWQAGWVPGAQAGF